MNFPDADFNIAATNNDGKIYSELSTSVEAFFQGANNVFKGADVNFSNKKVVLREIGTANKHSYTNKMVDDSTVARAHAMYQLVIQYLEFTVLNLILMVLPHL